MSDTDTMEAEAPSTSRSEALAASRQQKLDDLFKDKKYRVDRPINLEGDERFVTPFGNKGRNGFVLQLVDSAGKDVTAGENTQFIVGASMLQLVAATYGSVEVPTKERKRRTREQKEADDAAAAELKAAKQAAKEAERQRIAAEKAQLKADKAAKAAQDKANKAAAKTDPAATPAGDASDAVSELEAIAAE